MDHGRSRTVAKGVDSGIASYRGIEPDGFVESTAEIRLPIWSELNFHHRGGNRRSQVGGTIQHSGDGESRHCAEPSVFACSGTPFDLLEPAG